MRATDDVVALAAHDRVIVVMDKETIQQIATEVVAHLPFGARYSVVYGVVTVLIAALAIWFGSFSKPRGRTLLPRESRTASR